MLKIAKGHSDVARLFKSSKIAQLQMAINDPLVHSASPFPVQQVVEAPQSSFARRDFGLKMRLPRSTKVRRIVVEDLDNKYGLPAFERKVSHYHQKLNLKEMAVPVESHYSSQIKSNTSKYTGELKSPLFASILNEVESTSVADALNIPKQSPHSDAFKKNYVPALKKLGRPFRKWLALNYPEYLLGKSSGSPQTKKVEELLREFIKEIKKSQPELLKFNSDASKLIPQEAMRKLSGTAGLSYNLRGRLIQTPNGPITHRIQPARVVAEGRSLALGGFVASFSSHSTQIANRSQTQAKDGIFPREVCVPAKVKGFNLVLDERQMNVAADIVNSKPRKQSKGTSQDSKKNKNVVADLKNLLSLIKNQ